MPFQPANITKAFEILFFFKAGNYNPYCWPNMKISRHFVNLSGGYHTFIWNYNIFRRHPTYYSKLGQARVAKSVTFVTSLLCQRWVQHKQVASCWRWNDPKSAQICGMWINTIWFSGLYSGTEDCFFVPALALVEIAWFLLGLQSMSQAPHIDYQLFAHTHTVAWHVSGHFLKPIYWARKIHS